MPIYTRSGDGGESVLWGGIRIPKDSPYLEACGTLDELIAWLGLAVAGDLSPQTAALLVQLQRRLSGIIAEIVGEAAGDADKSKAGHFSLTQSDVNFLEETIDRLEAGLPPCHGFILPGGSQAAAILHVARTVCRRAERSLVLLAHLHPRPSRPPWSAFLNRLGDLLFVLARTVNTEKGIAETPVEEKPS